MPDYLQDELGNILTDELGDPIELEESIVLSPKAKVVRSQKNYIISRVSKQNNRISAMFPVKVTVTEKGYRIAKNNILSGSVESGTTEISQYLLYGTVIGSL